MLLALKIIGFLVVGVVASGAVTLFQMWLWEMTNRSFDERLKRSLRQTLAGNWPSEEIEKLIEEAGLNRPRPSLFPKVLIGCNGIAIVSARIFSSLSLP